MNLKGGAEVLFFIFFFFSFWMTILASHRASDITGKFNFLGRAKFSRMRWLEPQTSGSMQAYGVQMHERRKKERKEERKRETEGRGTEGGNEGGRSESWHDHSACQLLARTLFGQDMHA